MANQIIDQGNSKDKNNEIIEKNNIIEQPQTKNNKKKSKSEKQENNINTVQENIKQNNEVKNNNIEEKQKNENLSSNTSIDNVASNQNKLVVADANKSVQSFPPKKGFKIKMNLATILCLIFFIFILGTMTTFAIINENDVKIKKGISIEGIDVSELTKDEAKTKIQEEFLNNLDKIIYFQYAENQYSIDFEQINVEFLLDEAVENAYNIGRSGSIISKNVKVLTLPKHPENISIGVSYDEVALEACILDISSKLPEQVEQPSYYIEDGKLIITSGKIGKAADVDKTKEIVDTALNNKNYKDALYDIPTYDKYPSAINLEEIHSSVYREVKDAYFTTEPRMVYPEEIGVDFADSIEAVQAQIDAEQKSEYEVALKYTAPAVTVNDLGMEAFPDELGSFSTAYVNNKNRTTNLKLASDKINGKVIMPGETFSYNSIVGERTIAAGYKEAPIYVNGRVEDGLGGGICQVTTTLYNAVLFANLEIVERSNHMFLTSYAGGGRDATVAYGSIDFKFKNNRDYPIRVVSSVGNGYCTISIYGLRTEDDYEVKITTQKVGARTYKAYKNLYKDGALVGTELLSTDTYSKH